MIRCTKNAEGKRTTVPSHAGKTLHPRLMGAILKDAGLTPEQFQELMK
jgi:predicted RNA binding protein YcfA (HicA-like mRNA interferase family)